MFQVGEMCIFWGSIKTVVLVSDDMKKHHSEYMTIRAAIIFSFNDLTNV